MTDTMKKTLVKGSRRWQPNEYVSQLAMCPICAEVNYRAEMRQIDNRYYCEDCYDEPEQSRSPQLRR